MPIRNCLVRKASCDIRRHSPAHRLLLGLTRKQQPAGRAGVVVNPWSDAPGVRGESDVQACIVSVHIHSRLGAASLGIGSKAMAWSDCNSGYRRTPPPTNLRDGYRVRFTPGPRESRTIRRFQFAHIPVYYGRAYDRHHHHHDHHHNGVTDLVRLLAERSENKSTQGRGWARGTAAAVFLCSQ